MKSLIKLLIRLGLLKDDLDYHLVRGSMVIMLLFFGDFGMADLRAPLLWVLE